MIISIRDGFKLIGVTVVTFCAIFVCTIFLNFYLDARSLEGTFSDRDILALYNAQMATAKFCCAISGGVLCLIAIIMLIYYVRLYIDGHLVQLGILKAMGYSDLSIASKFTVFGLSVLLGAGLGFGVGYALMPMVYSSLSISGLPDIAINFHFVLFIFLVVIPTIAFAALSFICSYFSLRRPVSALLHGKAELKNIKGNNVKIIERSFLKEMFYKTLFGKKSLAFFVAFACFCFSAMVQMGASMYDLSTVLMGIMILSLGIVLAVTTMFMAITTLINSNIKNISIMKVSGYSMKECALTVLGGYHIFAFIGFALGTVYQYALLSLMVNIVYKDVAFVPEYSFNAIVFLITLIAFIIFYGILMFAFTVKMSKVSVKKVTTEY